MVWVGIAIGFVIGAGAGLLLPWLWGNYVDDGYRWW